MWVQLKRWCVSCVCVCVLQRGHSGDGCDLASTLCKYDLRKGDLFVLSWARVRRMRRGSISSELLMCDGGVRSILLFPLVARCLETIDVCVRRMFVFISVVVIVWGYVGKFVVWCGFVLYTISTMPYLDSERIAYENIDPLGLF